MVSSALWRPGVVFCDRDSAMKPPRKLCRFHVANLRSVDATIDRVARILRDSIAKQDEQTTHSFVRLYALLLAVWAECRLCKLLY